MDRRLDRSGWLHGRFWLNRREIDLRKRFGSFRLLNLRNWRKAWFAHSDFWKRLQLVREFSLGKIIIRIAVFEQSFLRNRGFCASLHYRRRPGLLGGHFESVIFIRVVAKKISFLLS